MEKLLLTPEEAAELLSIGRSKLYQLLAGGSLQSVTIGTSRRIPVQALQAFVDDVLAGRVDGGGMLGSGISPLGPVESSAEYPSRFEPGPRDAARRTA